MPLCQAAQEWLDPGPAGTHKCKLLRALKAFSLEQRLSLFAHILEHGFPRGFAEADKVERQFVMATHGWENLGEGGEQPRPVGEWATLVGVFAVFDKWAAHLRGPNGAHAQALVSSSHLFDQITFQVPARAGNSAIVLKDAGGTAVKFEFPVATLAQPYCAATSSFTVLLADIARSTVTQSKFLALESANQAEIRRVLTSASFCKVSGQKKGAGRRKDDVVSGELSLLERLNTYRSVPRPYPLPVRSICRVLSDRPPRHPSCV